MSLNKLTIALSLALLALPMSAMAQDDSAAPAPAAEEEADSNFSWNFSVTSDYVFRGVSQTLRKPAVQGGLDYSFGDSGFYVGGWGSNVDFGTGSPDIEVDTYVGWNHDLSDDWNFDLELVRYNYFGESSGFGSIDYTEVISVLTWNEMLGFTVGYADNYANLDYSSLYFGVTGTWGIGNDFNLNAGVGHTDFSDGNGSYNDWNIGISRQFGPVNAALNFFDTNISGPRAADQVVLSLALGG